MINHSTACCDIVLPPSNVLFGRDGPSVVMVHSDVVCSGETQSDTCSAVPRYWQDIWQSRDPNCSKQFLLRMWSSRSHSSHLTGLPIIEWYMAFADQSHTWLGLQVEATLLRLTPTAKFQRPKFRIIDCQFHHSTAPNLTINKSYMYSVRRRLRLESDNISAISG